MILWGLIVGGLFGLFAADFEQYGMILGAIVGAGAGWSLRLAVRAELRAMLADRGVEAAPAPAPAESAERGRVRIIEEAAPPRPTV